MNECRKFIPTLELLQESPIPALGLGMDFPAFFNFFFFFFEFFFFSKFIFFKIFFSKKFFFPIFFHANFFFHENDQHLAISSAVLKSKIYPEFSEN